MILSSFGCRLNSIAGKEEEPMIARAADMLPEVESSYAGPKLEMTKDADGKLRGKVTKEFVDGVRSWFKEGKVSCIQALRRCQACCLSNMHFRCPTSDSRQYIGGMHGKLFLEHTKS